MIGNDIIDIAHTRLSTNWQRRSFLEKVFTAEERLLIGKSKNPFITVWRLWSMKEAAYKSYIRDKGREFNSPSRIHIRIKGLRSGTAFIKDYSVEVVTEYSDDYIVSYVESNAINRQSHQVFKLISSKPESQTLETRHMLLNFIASRYNLEKSDLSIQKTSCNIPELYFRRQSLPLDISLSHHGYYGVFSVSLRDNIKIDQEYNCILK